MAAAIREPEYPCVYVGEDGDLLYGDYVRIVRELASGEQVGGRVFIGNWCIIEEYHDRQQYAVRRALVRSR